MTVYELWDHIGKKFNGQQRILIQAPDYNLYTIERVDESGDECVIVMSRKPLEETEE